MWKYVIAFAVGLLVAGAWFYFTVKGKKPGEQPAPSNDPGALQE